MPTTTADLLVERLLDWGVDTIFGLPGDGVNGIFESLRKASDRLRFIRVRHEEAAAFAACGAAGYTLEDPAGAERILREALAHPGPAVVEAVVDPNEPPLPGKITTEQALHFAESLARGQPERWEIIRTVAADKVREII